MNIALDDYLYVINFFEKNVDYFCINISSPNTASLKEISNSDFVKSLAQRLNNYDIIKKLG